MQQLLPEQNLQVTHPEYRQPRASPRVLNHVGVTTMKRLWSWTSPSSTKTPGLPRQGRALQQRAIRTAEATAPIITYSVADPDPDPGFGAFLTPGSGIRNRFFSGSWISDPGSQNRIIESLVTIFWLKFYNSLKIGPNFFLQHFKTKIIFSFVKFVAIKKV